MEGYYQDTTAYKAIKEVDTVKKDCFAYRKKTEDSGFCVALKELYCRCEECKFYKNKVDYEKEMQERYAADNIEEYYKLFCTGDTVKEILKSNA